jgi:hypothetical protein
MVPPRRPPLVGTVIILYSQECRRGFQSFVTQFAVRREGVVTAFFEWLSAPFVRLGITATIRGQGSGVRNQESGIRDQESEMDARSSDL